MADAPSDRITFTLRRAHVYAAGGLVVGFAAGVFAMVAWQNRGSLGANAAEAATAPSATPRVNVSTEGRPSRGPANAAVTIVEFTDYECPFCRQHFSQTLGPLLRVYGDSIRYVVRNFPIPSLHAGAVDAAVAAECAYAQDKFWEYHDRLFTVTDMSRPALRRYARELGLDVGRFDQCVTSPDIMRRVQQDVADGNAAGVAGTPAFFINGKFVDGALPFAVFALEIQKAATEARR